VLVLESALPIPVVQETTEHLLAKPLLLSLEGKSEACRELAINLLISLLQVRPLQIAVVPSFCSATHSVAL